LKKEVIIRRAPASHEFGTSESKVREVQRAVCLPLRRLLDAR
jgi:hypothetical protein